MAQNISDIISKFHSKKERIEELKKEINELRKYGKDQFIADLHAAGLPDDMIIVPKRTPRKTTTKPKSSKK